MKWSRSVSIFVALLTLTFLVIAASAAGLTPLQKAIQKGDIKKVIALLDKGANINEWNFGTPLIMAASAGQLEIARLLIERGANLNMIGQNGWTALGCAAAEGHSDIVDLLISKEADVDQAIQGMKTWAEWSRGLGTNLDQKLSQGAILIQKRAGQAYYASGQYEKAAAAFRAQIQSDPREPQNYVFLAFSDLAIKNMTKPRPRRKQPLNSLQTMLRLSRLWPTPWPPPGIIREPLIPSTRPLLLILKIPGSRCGWGIFSSTWETMAKPSTIFALPQSWLRRSFRL